MFDVSWTVLLNYAGDFRNVTKEPDTEIQTQYIETLRYALHDDAERSVRVSAHNELNNIFGLVTVTD